jgi:hypothetical protein
MSWSLDFLTQLEQRLNHQHNNFSLSDEEKDEILGTKLDYGSFRTDFDLSCRFIYIACHLQKGERFSKTFNRLMEHVLIVSTFLKNRTSPKLSTENEIYLSKASELLTIILTNAHDTTMPSYCSTSAFDCVRIFMAFSLINMHEIYGITKSIQVNQAAHTFIRFDLDMCENSLKGYSLFHLSDFKETGLALTETTTSKAFRKYSQFVQLKYLREFENHRILWLCIVFIVLLVIAIIITESYLNKFDNYHYYYY